RPEHGARAYVIEVELELPSNAVAWSTPWDQLQVFSRLDSAEIVPTEDATADTLRRAAVSLTALLAHARAGFERHCRAAAERAASGDASGEEDGRDPTFLTIWLGAALRLAREARKKLTQPTLGDTPKSKLERALVDEFVSVRLLELLADADRV